MDGLLLRPLRKITKNGAMSSIYPLRKSRGSAAAALLHHMTNGMFLTDMLARSGSRSYQVFRLCSPGLFGLSPAHYIVMARVMRNAWQKGTVDTQFTRENDHVKQQPSQRSQQRLALEQPPATFMLLASYYLPLSKLRCQDLQ
jgi:hypothetical protein